MRFKFTEMHGDPAKNAEAMRALFEKSVLKANKDRLWSKPQTSRKRGRAKARRPKP
jgi:hypothetical protein